MNTMPNSNSKNSIPNPNYNDNNAISNPNSKNHNAIKIWFNCHKFYLMQYCCTHAYWHTTAIRSSIPKEEQFHGNPSHYVLLRHVLLFLYTTTRRNHNFAPHISFANLKENFIF